mmetsp:Transcript_71022/g.179207  ORF Transcript_71022/g.179207 Transcript_71022/m.179207 type:complete len:349 (+) Transcript_71022:546-1592(+)
MHLHDAADVAVLLDQGEHLVVERLEGGASGLRPLRPELEEGGFDGCGVVGQALKTVQHQSVLLRGFVARMVAQDGVWDPAFSGRLSHGSLVAAAEARGGAAPGREAAQGPAGVVPEEDLRIIASFDGHRVLFPVLVLLDVILDHLRHLHDRRGGGPALRSAGRLASYAPGPTARLMHGDVHRLSNFKVQVSALRSTEGCIKVSRLEGGDNAAIGMPRMLCSLLGLHDRCVSRELRQERGGSILHHGDVLSDLRDEGIFGGLTEEGRSRQLLAVLQQTLHERRFVNNVLVGRAEVLEPAEHLGNRPVVQVLHRLNGSQRRRPCPLDLMPQTGNGRLPIDSRGVVRAQSL